MKLLLIDDAEEILEIGKVALEEVGGHTVHAFTSAIAGIAAALADPPDAILVDMMMPGMDGLAALARLQATPTLAHIPVLFMTAKVQRHETEQYVRMGARGVVQKPFDPMTLSADIEALLLRPR